MKILWQKGAGSGNYIENQKQKMRNMWQNEEYREKQRLAKKQMVARRRAMGITPKKKVVLKNKSPLFIQKRARKL
jgi:hypothetical protein